jgi:RecA/RadA recombinase
MSPIEVVGRLPELHRRVTGLWSFDWALGDGKDKGIVTRGGYEIYGDPETGKSTVAYYLAASLDPKGTVALIDLEVAARMKYIKSSMRQAGFDGKIFYVDHENVDGTPRLHWDMMREGADMLLESGVSSVILDSAAMVTPVMERTEDDDKSFMGRRAQLISRFNRRWVPWMGFVKEEKVVFIVNHMLQSFDAFGGKYSPGGKGIKFGVIAKLWIRRDETLPDGSFNAIIKVEKFRHGGRNEGRKANVVIIPGIGVSPQLTSIYDCFTQKVARRSKGSGMVEILVGRTWKKTSKMTTFVERAKAGNFETFAPFAAALDKISEPKQDEEEKENGA